MGALPIDTAAVETANERFVVFPNPTWHMSRDLVAARGTELTVADATTSEEALWSVEPEACDNLPELIERRVTLQDQAAADPPLLRQSAIPGQDVASLLEGAPHQLPVRDGVVVRRVQAERTEPPSQTTKHSVCDEPGPPIRQRWAYSVFETHTAPASTMNCATELEEGDVVTPAAART